MKDPIQVEESRRNAEEVLREYYDEQKRANDQELAETAQREMALGSAHAGMGDHANAGEEEVKQEDVKQEDANEMDFDKRFAEDFGDPGIIPCVNCRLDHTVRLAPFFTSFADYHEHVTVFHSRKARILCAFHLARRSAPAKAKFECSICEKAWTAPGFVDHSAELHPDL